MITQPLAVQAQASGQEGTRAVSFKDEMPRASGLLLWAFIIMFVGVATGVIGKMLIHQELVTLVGVLLSIAGMFLTVLPFLSPTPRKKHDLSPSPQAQVLTQPQPAKSLPQGDNTEYIPSITERTTNLLENATPARVRQKEREDGES